MVLCLAVRMNSEYERPSQAPPVEAADELPRSKKAGGYGKPPTHSRFTKGKTGNPRGRPVKVRSLQESARWALGQKIQATENGIVRSASIQEAILRKFAKDPRKSRFLFELACGDAQFCPRSPELDELIRIKKAHQVRLAYNARPRTEEELEEMARKHERLLKELGDDYSESDDSP